MAPTKKPQKATKKEKVFHPESRKAGQLARKQLRKFKLAGQASNRSKLHSSKADFYGFFFHAIPEERGNVLTLSELHELVADIWLTRHDEELEEERAARRKGRPKSTKEQKLEQVQLREAEEYRTGMEVPDLTHPDNVALYRTWDQREVAFLQLLRFIRISSSKPDTAIVSKPGKHPSLVPQQEFSGAMDVEAGA
ncbi:hypothetical protein DFH94DRAFT_795240 [Russula ochroleuca]|uniref:Translation machinery-associated protein 16 n=1 Tax=Russula ochroleuca TaxID=152965 RepID=A0A9P5MRH1_9AGAM|nr:hypothetical protein DFH94DRAFT_795240 [Russula ochroleuca]